MSGTNFCEIAKIPARDVRPKTSYIRCAQKNPADWRGVDRMPGLCHFNSFDEDERIRILNFKMICARMDT